MALGRKSALFQGLVPTPPLGNSFPARKDRECQRDGPAMLGDCSQQGLAKSTWDAAPPESIMWGKAVTRQVLLIAERPRASKIPGAATHTRGNQTCGASADWRRPLATAHILARGRRGKLGSGRSADWRRPLATAHILARGRRGKLGGGRSHPTWAGRAPPLLPTEKGACVLLPRRRGNYLGSLALWLKLRDKWGNRVKVTEVFFFGPGGDKCGKKIVFVFF